ncbi:hypothetical protein Sango_1175500 [Sesamum angolense]|uniref:Reverse transcriptase domain-containing protein n=1 Tax=Sesamum angolense TaxID=2727404 RepID=A0AAE1WWT9_9LAMI|nr:hypothetical protein Sango_1175500 [Sesamum angolense]
MVPTDDGDERSYKDNVEYEWVPPKCVNCMCLGHSSTTCLGKRVAAKAPVEVYVKRTMPNSEPVPSSTVTMTEPSTVSADETILEPRHHHIFVFVTVIYGANDIGTRRDLWRLVGNLFPSIGDELWLFMGDFNIVPDMVRYLLGTITVTAIRAYGNEKIICLLITNGWIGVTPCSYALTIVSALCFLRRSNWNKSCYNKELNSSDLKGGDQCSRIFFQKVAMRRAAKRVFQIMSMADQVDATLLSLISKVQVPATVADFRPISCCNVLYKAITKIMVQRLSPILECLISPSHNAFIPGRSISDNVLLDLFSGDFSFGFNWKYREIGLLQLCFADDLLLFCNADEASVSVFQCGL